MKTIYTPMSAYIISFVFLFLGVFLDKSIDYALDMFFPLMIVAILLMFPVYIVLGLIDIAVDALTP